MQLPVDTILGASTLNIGTISGGRAPNVIPDHAQAELFIRLVDSGDATLEAMQQAVNGQGRDATKCLRIPAVQLGSLARIRNHGGLVYHRHSRVRRQPGASRI